MKMYLRFEGLTKTYGPVRALDDLHLDVARGSILALLGPNGAGKSTLFGCLLGVIHPNAGRVILSGVPVNHFHRRRFGFVSDRITLYPHRTVRENASFLCRIKGADECEVDRQLARVGLGSVQHLRAAHLSRGMLQRLGLAIALCGQPEILVLDEPFNGLDPVLLEDVSDVLRAENDRGATLLIATHTLSAVEDLASHVAILLNGRIAVSDTTARLKAAHGCQPSLDKAYRIIARGVAPPPVEAVA